MTTVRELIRDGKGKPLLLTAASVNAATMIVREAVWKLGTEVQIIDLEFMDPPAVESAVNSLGSNIGMVIEVKRAHNATQEKLSEVMTNPDRTIIVAESAVPKHMNPKQFAHWAKF